MEKSHHNQKSLLIALAAIAMCLSGSAYAGDPATSSSAAQPELEVGMWVTVAPDGSVTQVVPGPTVPDNLQPVLIKRVSDYRFSVPVWQGRPVSLKRWFALRLQPVQTTSGGYALRVLGQGISADPVATRRVPPDYPVAAMRQGVGGTFVYLVRLETDGSQHVLRRLSPPDLPRGLFHDLDDSARAALDKWSSEPKLVDGTAVACEFLSTIEFEADAKKAKPTGEVAPDVQDRSNTGPEACPETTLESKIEATLL